MILMNQLSCTS